jgi:hypothetical protein
MNTAVQLRPIAAPELPRCDLVYGEPHELVAGELGRIALFGPGELVAYRLRRRRQQRIFVFRTLATNDPLATSVPGVRPGVLLLLALRATGHVRRARSLFAYLRSNLIEPAKLPDAFFARVGAALGGRLPSHKILPSLLQRQSPQRP